MPLEGVSRSFKDISFSFGAHPLTGDLVTLSNESAIARAVRNLVLTNLTERFFNRELGTNIRAALFENFDSVTSNIVEDRIRNVLIQYEPRVTVEEVEVTHDNDSYTLDCRITYSIIGQPSSLQELTFALISAR